MNGNRNNLKPHKIFYIISTIIIALVFIVTGIGNLLPFQHISNDMAALGYPAYFLKILGFWKILGGLAVVLPIPDRYKDFAYAGMMLDLTGAALSRYAVGEDISMILIPVLISIVVTLNFVVRMKMQRTVPFFAFSSLFIAAKMLQNPVDKMEVIRDKMFGSEDVQQKSAVARNYLRVLLGGKITQELIFK